MSKKQAIMKINRKLSDLEYASRLEKVQDILLADESPPEPQYDYLFDPKYEPKEIGHNHPGIRNAVEGMDDKLFGITYKILRGKLTDRNYQYIINNLNNHGQLIEHTFELDKSGRLHLHGLWRANTTRMQFRNLIHKGVHSKIVPIYDLDGWLCYMRKEQNKS